MTTEKQNLKKDTILVVDDHQKWLDVAKDNAIYYGAKDISYARTVDEGNRLFREINPTIVFHDINFDEADMRNFKGLEAIAELSKYKIPQQKIIAMSSFRGLKSLAKKAGADYFLRKRNFVEDFDEFISLYRK